MSISATIAALQLRHAAISGVATAPAETPATLPDANCPCILVDPMEATTRWDAHRGSNRRAVVRRYRVRGLVLRAGLGTGVSQARTTAATLLDAVLAGYVAAPDLSSTTEILITEAEGVRDSGVRPHPGQANVIVHGDEGWVGFEVDLLIEERL